VIRRAIQELVKLGPLPPEDAWDETVSEREQRINVIVRPVTTAEAAALTRCFGPDDCFGLAWTLVHLIESAPRSPVVSDPGPRANRWIRLLWDRAQRGRAKREWHPTSLMEAVDQVIEILAAPTGSGTRSSDWDRMIQFIAKEDSLPGKDYDLVESAVKEAFGGWSEAERRAIWLDTDCGMADDDGDDDMSIDACGDALRCEVLNAVMRRLGGG
jgi:hypothetical protein